MTREAAAARSSAGLRLLAGCVAAMVVAGGCHRSDGAPVAVPAAAIEARDAFYDVARAADGSLVIVGRYGKMLRSSDGGASWQTLASGQSGPLFSVAFADARRGVAVGSRGLILETTDGGLTWARRALETDRQLFLVRFTGGGRGFILGEFGTLWRTEDGGATWTPLALAWEELLPELAEQFGLVEPHVYDLAFCGAEHGWLVGEYGLILATTDGGRTWVKQRGGGLFDPHLFAVACTGPEAVVVGGQGGQLLFSADGGTTWSEESGDGRDVYDLLALDPERSVLALGDLGTLRLSTRAGQPGSWQSVAGARLGQPWLGRGLWMGSEVLVLGQLGVERLPLSSLAAPGRQQTSQRG